ncbi:MAG: tRNA(Ile)-lysidine synthase, partial [Arenicella sp.]
MLSKFRKFIQQEQLFQPTDKLILAISGGVDSVVLATLMKEIEQGVVLAHCNFQLRAEESDADEQFVRELALKLDLPCEVRHFETSKIAETKSDSIQMVARELRYEWFEELRQQYQAKYICTAHHLNDSLETAIFNLTKGTGIAGMVGIPLRAEQIVRPLLFVEKVEILEFAQSNQISWREDVSNQSNKYHRNLIRNEIIPLLKKINPSLEKTFVQTSSKLRSVKQITDSELLTFQNRIVELKNGKMEFSIPKLLGEAEYGFKLYEWLKNYGFTFSQVTDLTNSLSDSEGKKFVSNSHEILKGRLYIFLRKLDNSSSRKKTSISDRTIEVAFDDKLLLLSRVTNQGFKIPSSQNSACLDFAKLTFPLTLRPWKQGDSFQPLGMKGRKKVSDFLIDSKIPLHQKEEFWVLESAGEIAWLIGLRVSEKFKITQSTKTVYQVDFQNPVYFP